jgi:DNA-binding GntR family transcriptional regulator
MRKEKMGVDEWDEEELREEPPPLELMLLREAPTHLIRQSLSQQAGEAIKRRILSLDLPPGTRLVVDVLAEEMGVSRTPVREALRELVSQGLVTYDGNSYTVTRYTRRDVEEIFAIRRALEVLAARQAAERISPQALQELRALCEEGVRRLRERDAKFLVEMDSRFHEIIAEQSGNTRLQSMLASLRDQAWLIRRWGFMNRLAEYVETVTVAEHLAILERLEAHDPDGAAALMEEHLLRGEQRTLEWLGL